MTEEWMSGIYGLVGVVIKRQVWLSGNGCGYNVVGGWFCKEIYRFPHITYFYSVCISTFLQQYPYLFVHL